MKVKSFKFPTFIQNAVAIFRKDSSGTFRYGEKDNFPNELIEDITSSGTAKSCVVRLKQFTRADGFKDVILSKGKANTKQTWDALLGELAQNVVYSKSVIFRVFYSNLGEPSRIYAVPFNQIRRKEGFYIWNENFGLKTGYRAKDDKILQEYNPEEEAAIRVERVQKQIDDYGRQIGDIVYFFEKSIAFPEYPIPDYYSEGAINDIKTDAALSRVDLNNIKKGWRTPIVISTGPVDDVNKDENGKTAQDYLDSTLMQFVGEDAASLLHLKASTGEELAKITVLPLAEVINATTAKRDDIAKAVCRHFNVPPPLIGIAAPGELGNNQQLINQIKFMGITVIELQSFITSALNIVWPDKDFTISTLKLIDILPPEILAILTEEEKRQLYDLPVKPVANEATKVGI